MPRLFWPKSQIFRPKAGDLQKKKVFAEIANFNVFCAQKHQILPSTKILWGARKKNRGGIAPLPPPAGDAPVDSKKFLQQEQTFCVQCSSLFSSSF